MVTPETSSGWAMERWLESWILGTPQHSIGICGIDFIPMQYRGIDNWPGLHYHQYSVSYVTGHSGGSRIEQGISISRSNQSQCTALQCSTCRKWFRSRGGSCSAQLSVVNRGSEC